MAGYLEALRNAGKISKDSSVLIVVGRQDTGDLEAQVRGSKHAWTIRIISADALATFVTLKENTEQPNSLERIHELLIPIIIALFLPELLAALSPERTVLLRN